MSHSQFKCRTKGARTTLSLHCALELRLDITSSKSVRVSQQITSKCQAPFKVLATEQESTFSTEKKTLVGQPPSERCSVGHCGAWALSVVDCSLSLICVT